MDTVEKKNFGMKVAFEIVTTKTIDNQMIDDILVAAMEGGINYWCVRALPKDNDYKKELGGEYASDVISRGGTLVFKLSEPFDESGKLEYELTLENFKKGCELNQKNNPTFDFEEHDAGDADNIIQYALFGELIFG